MVPNPCEVCESVIANYTTMMWIDTYPTTLVETKAPVRHHDSLADDFGVLLSSLDRSGPRNEVEVYDSTNGVVLEELAV